MSRVAVLAGIALALLAPAPPARADYASEVLSTSGLVAYWPLDETSGTPVEAVGGLASTAIGSPSPGAPTARSDDQGAALSLYAAAVSVSGVPSTSATYTLEAWIAPSGGGSTRYILSRGSTNFAGYHLALDHLNRPVLTAGTSLGAQSLTGPAIPLYTWRHVAATVAGQTATLYVDGRLVATRTLTTQTATTSQPVILGRSARSTGGFWWGSLDEVAVYAEALPQATIAAHVAAGADMTPPRTTLTSAPPPAVAATDAMFAFAGSKSRLTFSCRIDGASAIPCPGAGTSVAGLREGDHTFSVRATDRYGIVESAWATYSWRVDLTAPGTLLLVARPPAADAGGTASFASEPGATFQCRLGTAGWAPCASPLALPAAPGARFAVRAVDAAGNADPTPATITLADGGARRAPTSFEYGSAAFDLAGARSAASARCRLDAGDWARCPSPLEFDELAPGSHSLTVRDADVPGTATLTWTVAVPAPRVAAAQFPALLSLGSRRAQRATSARRLPRLMFQSNVAATASVELRRRSRRVVRWTAPVVQGSNSLALPRTAWLRLRAGRYEISVTTRNAAGTSAIVRRRFDVVRRARR
jgi:concanavalin A-like lectin/glucanase superfamily protein